MFNRCLFIALLNINFGEVIMSLLVQTIRQQDGVKSLFRSVKISFFELANTDAIVKTRRVAGSR